MKKDGFWNYDKSEFASVEPLLDDDDALEAIWKKEHSLVAITAPDQFKSYEDLERRMNYVLGLNSPKVAATQSRAVVEQEDAYEEAYAAVVADRGSDNRVLAELEKSLARSKSSSLPQIDQEDEDIEDDALSFFQKLAE